MKQISGVIVALSLVGMLAVPGSVAQAQSSFQVDAPSSLAWWQVTQPKARMWGTTCPEDPSWQASESASKSAPPSHAGFNVPDSVHARHLRRSPRSACGAGVDGTIEVADTAGWRGAHGTIVLRAEALVTGLEMRDVYARRAVLQTVKYPEIRFTIDSLTQVQGSETIEALAVGTFEFRGRTQPMTVPIIASRQAGGLRVRAQFEIPVTALIEKYGVPKTVLGLATHPSIWGGIRVGVDVVMNPTEAKIATTP